MAIYRGPGGSGDAVNDASSETRLAVEARDAAIAAKVAAETAQAAAELAETHAETAETNAETAETNAETAATNAANSASSASTSATNAANSATAAQTAETNAETAETNAETAATSAASSASAASTSATNAASSASTASTAATNAGNSATAAAASASSASSSASTATTQASNASTSATNAASSASSASSSASTATTQAGIATTQATNASNSASAAATSATNASNSASAASTSASNAATSATAAQTAKTNAETAQAAAESARDATLAAYDSFDDRYLGVKSSDPTLDNDGNALVAGSLYFSSTDNAMKVYTGSAWVAAYVSGAGTLLAANNLSDVSSASSARTNLGLGTIATLAAPSGTVVGTSDTQTLTNKTLTSPAINGSVATTGLNFDSNTFVIDATNNRVGVGTASPSSNVDIIGAASASSTVRIEGGSGANTNAVLDLTGRGSGNQYNNTEIRGIGQNTNGGALVFYVDDTSGNLQERMRLDSSGNLGLGTTSATRRLSVNDDAGNGILITRSTTSGLAITFPSNVPTLSATVSGTSLAFSTESSERMRITSTGNVGVGTSSPAAKFTVSHSTNTNPTLTANAFAPVSFNNAGVELTYGVYTSSPFAAWLQTKASGGAWDLAINPLGGNVGIGTSSPSAVTGYTVLTLNNASNGGIIDFQNNTSLVGRIYNNATNFHIYNQTANSLLFGTGGVERMRLDSSGNLGLGLTPYGWGGSFKAIDFGDGGSVASNAATNARLVQNAFFNGTNWIYKTTNFAGKYDIVSSAHQWFTAASGTAGNAITFTQAMTLTANGRLGIGTTSPSAILHSSAVDANYPFGVNGTTKGFRVVTSATETKIQGVDSTLSASYQPLALGGSYLAFETNGTTEAMRITSTGSVLVGTTTTTNFIDRMRVVGDTNGVDLGGSASTGSIRVRGSDTGAGLVDFTRLSTDPNNSPFYQGRIFYSFNTNHMSFATNSAERMRIDASGNIGIGTTTPATPLVISNAGAHGLEFSVNNASAGTGGTLIESYNRTAAAYTPVRGIASLWRFDVNAGEGIRIDSSSNFQFNSGYGSVATAYGCRAWVNFNGTGTVAIRASGNVSSITDNGQGDYTVNFTTAMPDANYTVTGGVKPPSSFSSTTSRTVHVRNDSTITTSSVRVVTPTAGAGYEDFEFVYVLIHR